MGKETRQNLERDLKDPLYRPSRVFAHYIRRIVDRFLIKIILEDMDKIGQHVRIRL